MTEQGESWSCNKLVNSFTTIIIFLCDKYGAFSEIRENEMKINLNAINCKQLKLCEFSDFEEFE